MTLGKAFFPAVPLEGGGIELLGKVRLDAVPRFKYDFRKKVTLTVRFILQSVWRYLLIAEKRVTGVSLSSKGTVPGRLLGSQA